MFTRFVASAVWCHHPSNHFALILNCTSYAQVKIIATACDRGDNNTGTLTLSSGRKLKLVR